MAQKPKKRNIPHEIFLVDSEFEFRIYTSEGQAINWALKQKENNRKTVIHTYLKKDIANAISTSSEDNSSNGES